MINTASALGNTLSGTQLADRAIIELPILDTEECAYAIRISDPEIESSWRFARSLVTETGRWPLVVTCWGGRPGTSWEDQVREEDLFSRWFYRETSPDKQDVSPAAILRAADSIDVAAFLDREAATRDKQWPLERAMEYDLQSTESLCGTAPSRSEVQAASLDGRPVTSAFDLDRWLLQWERARGASRNPQNARSQWFPPGLAVLLFLPTSNSWDSLAYKHWYGMFRGAPYYVALGRHWRQRFGAELVCKIGRAHV